MPVSDEPEKLQKDSVDSINVKGRATDMRPAPQGLYEWLDRLRENPAMYFGRTNMSDISAWITGFWCGRQDAGLGLSEEEIQFRGFHEFVRKKYGLPPTSHGWHSNIRYMNSDDKQAFDEFFRLLGEFREMKRKAREREAKRAAKTEKEEI